MINGINKFSKYLGFKIPKADFGGMRADLTDMNALYAQVSQARAERLRLEEESKANQPGGSLFGKIIPDQFQMPGGNKTTEEMMKELTINNNNVFNVSDKYEMQKMLDESNLKLVEDLKRQINP
jgi:hypothetical protein